MSVRASTASPRICSGAEYPAVPMYIPGRVIAIEACRSFAMPKSRTFTTPSASRTMMFSGLRSRWTTPIRWASLSPRAASAITDSARSTVNGPPPFTMSW